MPPKEPLTRRRVLDAAVRVADRGGVAAITMRKVAEDLGVEAMSLYRHVPNKDAILDGVVDVVFDAIRLPEDHDDWRDTVRARMASARQVLARHPWALGLVDSRRHPGPATLRHHNASLGVLRRAGFDVAGTVHAISLLDSYLTGFVLQEANLPVGSPDEVSEVAGGILQNLSIEELPYIAEVIAEHALRPDYDHHAEFDHGLDVILDGLEERRRASSS